MASPWLGLWFSKELAVQAWGPNSDSSHRVTRQAWRLRSGGWGKCTPAAQWPASLRCLESCSSTSKRCGLQNKVGRDTQRVWAWMCVHTHMCTHTHTNNDNVILSLFSSEWKKIGHKAYSSCHKNTSDVWKVQPVTVLYVRVLWLLLHHVGGFAAYVILLWICPWITHSILLFLQ